MSWHSSCGLPYRIIISMPPISRSAVTVPFTIRPRFLSTDTWTVPPPRSSTAPGPIYSRMSPPNAPVKTLTPSESRSVAREDALLATVPAPESDATSW